MDPAATPEGAGTREPVEYVFSYLPDRTLLDEAPHCVLRYPRE